MIRSAEEFVELHKKNDPRATHDKALKSVWVAIIRRYPEYKEWIVHNKTVPVSILRLLARDSDADVRFAVAMKRRCPPDVFKQLASDEHDSVRERVAWNEKTPLEILMLLVDDPCDEVAEVATSRLEER